MPLSIVKETIELEEVTFDGEGNAFLTKRINLERGKQHRLLQVDYYTDAYPSSDLEMELVISAYPQVPTDMRYQPATNLNRRYVAGGDDSVLFKARATIFRTAIVGEAGAQFPSPEIASQNKSVFYTDHVYINMHLMGPIDGQVLNIAFSFMLVLDDKNVNNLVHTIGVLAEQHDAMCALIMSNGRMVSRDVLEGNTFPMWRYGGIRPEHMVADTFWLQLSTTDDELMASTTVIRGQVASARTMAEFDEAFGTPKYPDWIKMNLNQGITTGPIRADPIPLKYADNGNTRMF